MFCQYVLLFVAVASVARVTCDHGPYIIYHISGEYVYVLDGSDHDVKVQPYTESDSQYWMLELAEMGRLYLKNKASGKVLDIEGNATSKANVITADKDHSEKQQWYMNADRTIANGASTDLAVDIPNTAPGTKLILFHNNGGGNQQFLLF